MELLLPFTFFLFLFSSPHGGGVVVVLFLFETSCLLLHYAFCLFTQHLQFSIRTWCHNHRLSQWALFKVRLIHREKVTTDRLESIWQYCWRWTMSLLFLFCFFRTVLIHFSPFHFLISTLNYFCSILVVR